MYIYIYEFPKKKNACKIINNTLFDGNDTLCVQSYKHLFTITYTNEQLKLLHVKKTHIYINEIIVKGHTR